MKLNKDYVFDEIAFKEWLNNDSCIPFQLFSDKDKYSRGNRLSKLKQNEEFCLLFKYDPYYLGNLKDFYISQHSNPNEFKGIYIYRLNTIIYESSYDIQGLQALCIDVQITDFYSLYQEMFEKINAEFDSRLDYLKDYFKDEKELIEEKKKTNKKYAFQYLTGYSEDRQTQFMSDYKWKDIRNRELAYQYLHDKDSFIKEYVDEYLKDENALDNVRHITCYLIAYDEIVAELITTKQYKQGQFLMALYRNELNGAKKVWIMKREGKEVQVENRVYDMEMNSIRFGDYRNTVDFEDIAYIRYGRKEYPFPKFD